jgi:hypothetical protein
LAGESLANDSKVMRTVSTAFGIVVPKSRVSASARDDVPAGCSQSALNARVPAVPPAGAGAEEPPPPQAAASVEMLMRRESL